MPRFALIVTIKLKPGSAEKFEPLILENRGSALSKEKGCRHFIVLKNLEEEETFHFYEEYDDQAAFKAHQESEHYKKYFQAAKDMMAERIWKRCEVIE